MEQPKASVIICSDIASHLETKNLSFIQAFDGLQATGFPMSMAFYAVGKVWGLAEGQTHSLILRVMDPGGKEISRAGAHSITPGAGASTHTAISRFSGITFPVAGRYEIQALLGEETVIGSYPLDVRQATGS